LDLKENGEEEVSKVLQERWESQDFLAKLVLQAHEECEDRR